MTYHHQLKKDLEFDVFSYVNDKEVNVPNVNGKVYVKIDRLFTRDMLQLLMRNKLPDGTNYNVEHFVFQNVDNCVKSVCEMYKTLQNIKKYNEYCTLCLSMLEDTYEHK